VSLFAHAPALVKYKRACHAVLSIVRLMGRWISALLGGHNCCVLEAGAAESHRRNQPAVGHRCQRSCSAIAAESTDWRFCLGSQGGGLCGVSVVPSAECTLQRRQLPALVPSCGGASPFGWRCSRRLGHMICTARHGLEKYFEASADWLGPLRQLRIPRLEIALRVAPGAPSLRRRARRCCSRDVWTIPGQHDASHQHPRRICQ
jgi:hypothetical protein